MDGMVSGYLYQAAVMLTGIWLTPFLLHRLGQHDYGIWIVGLQLTSYVTLLDFGVLAILPRDVAYARARGGEDLNLLLGGTTTVVCVQTLVIAAASGAIWFYMSADWAKFRTPLGLLLLGCTASYPLKVFPAILEGLQELGFNARARMVSWLISTAAVIVLVALGFGLNALALSLVLNQFIMSSAAAWRLKKVHPQFLPHLIAPNRLKARDFTRGTWVALGQLQTVLLGGIDVLVIGRVLGAAAIVPYSCTSKLTRVLQNQPHMIVQNALPGLSEMKKSLPAPRILAASSALNFAMFLASGLLAVVIMSVNEGFVRWWVGDPQFGGITLTFALVAAMVASHFAHTIGYTLFCFGHEKLTTISAVAEGLVNLAVVLILVSRFGVIGVPIGSILSSLLVALPIQVRALARELKVSVWQLIEPVWPVIWRQAILLAAAWFVSTRWVPRGPFWLAVTSCGACVTYGFVMFPTLRRPPIGQYIHTHFPAVRSWWLLPLSGKLANRESACEL